MLIIGEEIITAKELVPFLEIKATAYLNANDILGTMVKSKSAKSFFTPGQIEYDYRILALSEEDLKIFLQFFHKFPLINKEYLAIKRWDLNLKTTFELINEYKQIDLVDRIYVEQLDKNEWVNFEEYEKIYYYLKDFDRSLPNHPTNLDIIVNAYDYVKQDEYKMYPDINSLIPKKFSTSIITPYCVCSGFVKKFNGILKEYGIPCYEYLFTDGENYGHDVSLVYLEGKGIYFFDITRDCYEESHQKDYLKNETKYSGFMLTYTDYLNQKICNDNFDAKLFKKEKWLELKQRYSKQQIAFHKDECIDIFDEKDFVDFQLLQSLIDVNLQLLQDENFFSSVSNQREWMTLKTYEALSTMIKNFGNEIHLDTFIDILIHAKKDTEFGNNYQYYIKSILSKFYKQNDLPLGDAIQVITKKLAQ